MVDAPTSACLNGLTENALHSMNPLVQRLETMLEAGSDNLLLRFGLGKAYADMQQYERAIVHLECAVLHDAHHSGAWFWLGRAQYALGRFDDAHSTLQRAMLVASRNKDSQTVKMAQVFLRRLSHRAIPVHGAAPGST
jgi:tetratricopeptide (TPR) repeat protein